MISSRDRIKGFFLLLEVGHGGNEPVVICMNESDHLGRTVNRVIPPRSPTYTRLLPDGCPRDFAVLAGSRVRKVLFSFFLPSFFCLALTKFLFV